MARQQMHVLLGAMVMVCSVAAAAAASYDNLPCLDWTGPSKDNSFYDEDIKCSANEIVDWLLPRVIIGVLFLVISLLLFLFCPCVFCARYVCNCCGSHKQRPGNCCCGGAEWDDRDEQDRFAAYTDGDIKCAKYSTFLLGVMGIIVVALVFTGVSRLVTGFDEVTSGLHGGVRFFRDIADDVQLQINRPGRDPLIDNSSFTELYDVMDRMDRELIEHTDNPRKITRDVATIVGYTSLIPVVIMFGSIVAAMANIRICLPALLIVCCFFFQLIYSASGASLLLANNLMFKTVCTEVDLQRSRDPGLFQWLFIPRCQHHSPFDNLREGVDDALQDAIDDTCTDLSDVCSSNPNYNPSDPNRVFVCNLNSCRDSFEDLNAVIANMVFKNGAESQCNVSNCTIRDCVTHCTDASVRTNAHEVTEGLEDAERVVSAYQEYVRPWLDCNALIDKVIDIAFVPMCAHLPQGIELLAAGLLLATAAMWITIVILFRGQKRFIDKSKYFSSGEEGQAMAGKYVPMNSASAVAQDPYGGGVEMQQGSLQSPHGSQQPYTKVQPDDML